MICRKVCLLLKRGADLSSVNAAHEDALSIAINNANADIVTLYCQQILHLLLYFNCRFYTFTRLRLKKLKDEMKHEDLSSQNDDTFNEVLQIMMESTSKTNTLQR